MRTHMSKLHLNFPVDRDPAMPGRANIHNLNGTPRNGAAGSVAAIYNQAGDGYAAYADGDPEQLFVFDGLHAYADRYVWRLLDAKLTCALCGVVMIRSFAVSGCAAINTNSRAASPKITGIPAR